MKHLTQSDIEQMANGAFVPDMRAVSRDVRAKLKLGQLIPPQDSGTVPDKAILDLHNHTVEMAWSAIMKLCQSGVRRATVITGASGVLRQLFPEWVRESVISPYIISATPINNGSFDVRFHRMR
ncbi:MAG: Smr/MutS family protein [Alphaproteobacteria bacterium]|nr:Smr/MutS family protein [Alphaproteobacteria bacterium]